MGIFRKKHDISDIYGVRSKQLEGIRLPDSPTKRTFNRHYHNYFRGYTEIRRKDEKGRIKIERYYIKPWIVSGLSSRNYWLLRALYVILTVAAIALYITAMTRDIPGNYHWVVALPGMPTIIVLFLQVVTVVQYLTVPKKMTLWDHESSTKHIKRAALAAAGIMTLTALTLTGFLVATCEAVKQTLLCVLLDLIAAACSAAIFFVERKVPYTEAPNDTKLPDGEAHQIR